MNWISTCSSERPEDVSRVNFHGDWVYTIRPDIQPHEDFGYVWHEYTFDQGVWNYGAIVAAIIRMRYSSDDVEAIVNNVLCDPFNEERLNAYKALQEWRAKAKVYTSELMAWADEHGIGEVATDQSEDGYEATEVEVVPDGVTMLMQGLTLLKAQAQELPDEQAAEVPALFPAWESFIGQQVEVGKRLFYAGRLWKVLQGHVVQAEWTPDVVPSLFTEVAISQEQGTLDNPIPYNGNMELEEGKYYSQDGVVYRCFRSTGAPVYHPLSQLVGLYVEVVN